MLRRMSGNHLIAFPVKVQQCRKYAHVNLTFPRAEQFLCVFTVIDSSLVSSLAFVVSSTLSRASSPFSFLLCPAHFSLSCRLISCIFFIRGSAALCSGSSGFVNSIPAFFSVDSFLPARSTRCNFICNNLFRELSRLRIHLPPAIRNYRLTDRDVS